MRPHRLRVCAFGPFADTVEVDLDVLSAGGLFLLQGETGSGKTTLLDALGFALYGQVPGTRQQAGRLRSDHAPADVRTSVQLEATLAGRRIRLTRSPAQERPKARGEGTTTEPAKVLLEEREADGTWRAVSSRAGEADAEVKDLVGMSADQFFQVVLLPQGDFARFLRAGSKERGELLQKLFGTQRFSQVESFLAEQRRTTAAAAAAAGEGVRQAAALVRQAAGEALQEPELLVAPAPDLLVKTATAWLDVARQRAQRTAAAAASAEAEREQARAQAQEATRLASAQDRRRGALLRRDRSTAGRAEVDSLRAELASATRAAVVQPVLREAQRREHEREKAGERVAGAVQLVVDLLHGEAPTHRRLQGQVEVLTRRTGRLEQLQEVEQSRRDDLEAAAAASRDAATCVRRLEVLDGLLADLPLQQVTVAQGLAAAQAAAVQLPAVQADVLVLRAAVADAHALAEQRARAAAFREELVPARETSVSLREKASDVREARLDAMVFELATMLQDDAPCPVCGALEHPDPSEVRGDRVTREDEERAARLADDARRAVEELTVALASAEATVAQLAQRLGGQERESAEELRVRLEAAEALESSLLEQSGRSQRLAADLLSVQERQVQAETEAASLGAQRDGALRRESEAQERVGLAEDRLRDELAGAADLAAALTLTAQQTAACQDALQALEDASRTTQEWAAAQEALVVAAVAAGFTETAQAASAVRDAARTTQIEAALRSADDERAAVEALLADPDLAVALEPAADVAGTSARLRRADDALEAAVAARTSAQEQAAELAELVPGFQQAVELQGPLQDRADQVRHLADLVAGGGANALKMTLSSFVLAARLEEVAAAASERLLRMSQGRYSLVHSDGVRGGARSGLGLLARDTWTGHDRDTSTLSGGETFLASLSLALGLADVVTAEAGGARIEALFVDEGFGTLDEQTLDEVMDVLDGLREGGRVVGLISHVPELRQRIPAQLRVHKGRRGSSISMLGC